jgi:hypothetical protein
MELSERLEKYREILKMLDISTKALVAAGFIRNEDGLRQEKFILKELLRVERALAARGKPTVQKVSGRERLVLAAELPHPETDGRWKERAEELRKEQ